MREMMEWKTFQTYSEMDENEKKKAIRDNFEMILELMQERDEFEILDNFIRKESDRLGLETIPFVSDNCGNIEIRSSSLCCAYQNHFSSLELNPDLIDSVRQAKEAENWFTFVFGKKPNIEIFYDSQTEEIFINFVEVKFNLKQYDEKEQKELIQKLKLEDEERVKEIEMKMIFSPLEAKYDLEKLIYDKFMEKEKLLSAICLYLEEELKCSKKKFKEILKTSDFEVKLSRWFAEHTEYVFSVTGEIFFVPQK